MLREKNKSDSNFFLILVKSITIIFVKPHKSPVSFVMCLYQQKELSQYWYQYHGLWYKKLVL